MTSTYVSRLVPLLDEAVERNQSKLVALSDRLATTIANNGLVHLFGCGHSVLPCQEAFPRYGGYVGFNPLMDPRVMWHNVLASGGVRELLFVERSENYIKIFLDHHPLTEGDAILIFSHSGRNAAGIEAALYAKQRGLHVVGVTSLNNAVLPPTHSSGKRLADVVDVVIDTGAPVEDAIVSIDGWDRPVSGSSTVIAMTLIHEITSRTAQALANRGVTMPVFASPTIPGVGLDDADAVYEVHRQRMVDAVNRDIAQRRRAPNAA